jgi:hypothetical protein
MNFRFLIAIFGLGIAGGMLVPGTGVDSFGAGVRGRLADPLVVLVMGLGLCIFAAAFVPLKRRP